MDQKQKNKILFQIKLGLNSTRENRRSIARDSIFIASARDAAVADK